MGFVVERHIETPTAATVNGSDSGGEKKNQAVVYGKAEYMWNVSNHAVAIGLLDQLTGIILLCYWSKPLCVSVC